MRVIEEGVFNVCDLILMCRLLLDSFVGKHNQEIVLSLTHRSSSFDPKERSIWELVKSFECCRFSRKLQRSSYRLICKCKQVGTLILCCDHQLSSVVNENRIYYQFSIRNFQLLVKLYLHLRSWYYMSEIAFNSFADLVVV